MLRTTHRIMLTILIALVSLAAECDNKDTLVVIEYRHLADITAWETDFKPSPNGQGGEVPPPIVTPVGQGYSIYEVTTVKNTGAQAKPFTLDISRLFAGPQGQGSSVVVDAQALVPKPMRGVVRNLTPPRTTLAVAPGRSETLRWKILVRRDMGSSEELLYATPKGEHLVMHRLEESEPKGKVINPLTAENFPERRKDLIIINYRHFQNFKAYLSGGQNRGIGSDIGSLYRIKSIRVEPEAEGKGTFLLSRLRSIARDSAVISPSEIKLHPSLGAAITDPLSPASQLVFTNVKLDWVVMVMNPNLNYPPKPEFDNDIPLVYLPVGDENVILKGDFRKIKWINEGLFNSLDAQ
jgi:hypothetical protein